MKILFINSHSADYVQDLTYSGLIKIFGKQNVIDFKWNKKYHIPYKKYPKNLGYTDNTIFSSIKSRFPFRFDIVFIGASKVDCFETYLSIIEKIPSAVPVIFIDGGDQSKIGFDLSIYKRPELYEKATSKREFDFIFKREYLVDTEYAENVAPLPMSFNYDRIPKLIPKFKYDVSFWAVESYPIRTEALKLLENKFDCAKNGTYRNQKFNKYKRKGDFYLQELSSCKVVLNFRGGGWDTLRYWEVPAISGFMITQKPGIVIPNNYEDNKHVIYCNDSLDDLLELCEYYLVHDSKREEISRNAAKHTREYHTDTARVKYIFNTINIKF